jgi:CBS domain-containing protein
VRGHDRGGRDGGADRRGRGLAAPAIPEIADFLRAHPPFDALDHDDVERVAAAAEVEFHRAGATIFTQGAEPIDHLRVVRSGTVELVHDGRVLDLLGTGELFGQASMLSGLPVGFTARAQENVLCYRIPADAARGPLGRPQALGFLARSLLASTSIREAAEDAAAQPADQPVASLLRTPLVLCGPETSIREAALRMTGAGATSLVVDLGDDGLGITTDRDLRTRVVGAGLPYDAPVARAMSAPAYTVQADRLGGEVLLDMLDRGIRHFPVVSATGEVLGVIEDSDLVAVETRSSFHLRASIGRAASPDEVAAAARGLRPTLVALRRARIAPEHIAAVCSVVIDALTRRLLALAVEAEGEPAAPFTWLALGSVARREATPSADMDTAVAWRGGDRDPAIANYVHRVAVRVDDGLAACGFHPDANGASASRRLFARSLDSWQRAARSWLADPTQEKALILVSVAVDSRPVWGLHVGAAISEAFRTAPQHRQLLRLLARFALFYRPPTGFLRGLVVEHSGEHRGQLDLKHGGMVPIVGLARWAGMAAGVTCASTTERLRLAAEAGTLSATDARTLTEALELVLGLRLEYQLAQIEAGGEPDDHVDPATLSPLTRSYLKEAFRAVASVQRRVAADLAVGVRA